MLQMFVWDRVEALRQHAPGTVAVIADGLEAARQKARERFSTWAEESPWYDPTDDADNVRMTEWKAQFDNDLATTPLIREVLLIEGSE